ncbi:hypothetical protein [Sinorhizobium meliloti]|uniref:hypothetical protein n=1 Tax=Rhizobium meliloti TaxID=382 RepID=UPI0004209B41|nr:hypothetical protein [Sinorhizobium meliloti]UFX08700.1 hypothetical protein SmelRRI128_01910 [Sinorhizobium meliloti]
MPRFPTYDRQQGLSGGATASFQSPGAFTAPAQALADLGDSTADLGHSLNVRQQKVRNSQGDTWLSLARAETALEMQNAQNELRQQATDGAQGYTDMVKARYEQVRQRYLKSAPDDRARQMFDEWSNSYSANVIGDAATFQAESTLSKRNDDFAKAMLAHSQVVLSDPSQYDAVAKRAMDDLAGASQWMTPDQELKARNTVTQELQLARAKAEIQRDPAKFLQEIGVSTPTEAAVVASEIPPEGAALLNTIAGTESPDYNVLNGGERFSSFADHPRRVGRGGTATAAGRYQFVEKTWDRASTAVGAKDFSPASQDRSAWWLAQNDYKANTGRDLMTDMRAGRYTEIRRALGSTWEGLKSLSDSEFASRVTKGSSTLPSFAGGSPNVAGNERFSGLDAGQVLGLQQQAESQVAAISRQEQAAATAQLAQIKGSLQLGIATGDTSITPHTILSSPLLDDDKAQLIKSYNEANEASMAVGRALPLLREGRLGDAIDPYDSKGKKLVDDIYDKTSSAVGEDQRQPLAEEIVQQTGVVPQSVLNSIRKGLTDTNVANVEAAAQQAARIAAINPAALSRRDGGSEVQKRADDFNYFVNSLNMSPEEAAKRIAEMNDPDKQRDRKALEPAAKEFTKQIEGENLAEVFDESWMPFNDPDIGFTEGQALGIQAEYQAIAQEQFFQANGNADIARNRAKEEMKRLYGVTNLTGRPVVMKHPPRALLAEEHGLGRRSIRYRR